jgi:anti-sigma regulatory factor (Ser/Thr protein kinase)
MESNLAIDMELFLDPTPPAAGSARRALRSAAIFGDAAEPDALLLISELVTNSIVHAGHSGSDAIRVRAGHDGSTARVEVCDRARGRSVPQVQRDTAPTAEGGRGLMLVDALSDRWGMDTCDRGTCVWFELEE